MNESTEDESSTEYFTDSAVELFEDNPPTSQERETPRRSERIPKLIIREDFFTYLAAESMMDPENTEETQWTEQRAMALSRRRGKTFSYRK